MCCAKRGNSLSLSPFGHRISKISIPLDHDSFTRNPVPNLSQVLPGRYQGSLDALLLDAMQNGRPKPLVLRGSRTARKHQR